MQIAEKDLEETLNILVLDSLQKTSEEDLEMEDIYYQVS